MGTFVCGCPLDYNPQSLVSFIGKAHAAGKKPTTQLLRFETQAVSLRGRDARLLKVTRGAAGFLVT